MNTPHCLSGHPSPDLWMAYCKYFSEGWKSLPSPCLSSLACIPSSATAGSWCFYFQFLEGLPCCLPQQLYHFTHRQSTRFLFSTSSPLFPSILTGCCDTGNLSLPSIMSEGGWPFWASPRPLATMELVFHRVILFAKWKGDPKDAMESSDSICQPTKWYKSLMQFLILDSSDELSHRLGPQKKMQSYTWLQNLGWMASNQAKVQWLPVRHVHA